MFLLFVLSFVHAVSFILSLLNEVEACCRGFIIILFFNSFITCLCTCMSFSGSVYSLQPIIWFAQTCSCVCMCPCLCVHVCTVYSCTHWQKKSEMDTRRCWPSFSELAQYLSGEVGLGLLVIEIFWWYDIHDIKANLNESFEDKLCSVCTHVVILT